jgi:peroxiredoxin
MWLTVMSLYFLLLGSGDRAGGSAAMRPDHPSAGLQSAGQLPEPPLMIIRVGDPAPNFSFQGFNGRWMRLHHLLDQGSVLLVFGATEADLRRLQSERGGLLDLGVIPVAVLDDRPGVVRNSVKRLGLQYTVLSDPRAVIADQFNVSDDREIEPSWFILDQRGRVRGLNRGSLASSYTRVAARSLALPMPGAIFPGSTH